MDEVTNETPRSHIGDMEFTDEELKRFVEKRVSAYSSFPGDSKPPQPKQNGYGVSVAMLAWSLAFLLFPKFVAFPLWLAYCFYIVGFAALLIGVLGLSIEVFKGKS